MTRTWTGIPSRVGSRDEDERDEDERTDFFLFFPFFFIIWVGGGKIRQEMMISTARVGVTGG